MDTVRAQSYRSWLLGEILLVGLLVSGTALFALSESLPSAYELHDVRLVVRHRRGRRGRNRLRAPSIRFLVEGRTLDLLVAAGFWSIALGTVFFGLAPVLAGGSLTPAAHGP